MGNSSYGSTSAYHITLPIYKYNYYKQCNNEAQTGYNKTGLNGTTKNTYTS